jgi:DIE2/ALG10 family
MTRQTNIIWVAFTMAASMIRELKDVDIVKLEEEEKSELPRGWMLYDPPAIDAAFPRTRPTFHSLNSRRLSICDPSMRTRITFSYLHYPANSIVIRTNLRRRCRLPVLE